MNQNDISTLFSSSSDEWATPQDFYDKLNAEFHFTLDPCASTENHKCDLYFTREQDGLSQSRDPGTTVVMLIHARTDTRWFHDWVYGKAELRFLRGRLHFNNRDRAPFPSLVAIYRGGHHT